MRLTLGRGGMGLACVLAWLAGCNNDTTTTTDPSTGSTGHMTGQPCSDTCTANTCGDGDKGPGEECDDGNMVNTDACTNMCKSAKCGDTIIQAGVEAATRSSRPARTATSACSRASGRA